MSPESFKEKPTAKKERLATMNNFFAYLPGGWYRKINDEETNRIMSAIDRPLKEEFPYLDAFRVYETIAEAQNSIADIVNSGRYKSSSEIPALIRDKVEAAEKAYEELRPLFDRLVEMGFSPELLAR